MRNILHTNPLLVATGVLFIGFVILVLIREDIFVSSKKDSRYTNTSLSWLTPRPTFIPLSSDCEIENYYSNTEKIPTKFIFTREGNLNLYENGNVKLITHYGSTTPYVSMSPDKKTIYYGKTKYIENVGTFINAIEAYFLPDDTTQTVATFTNNNLNYKTGISSFSVSPNGRYLAYTGNGLWLKNLENGELKQIAKSTYYDQEIQGHAYNTVKWISDEFIFTRWGGYEVEGGELFNINTGTMEVVEEPHYINGDILADFIVSEGAVYISGDLRSELYYKNFNTNERTYIEEQITLTPQPTSMIISEQKNKINVSINSAVYSSLNNAIYYIRNITEGENYTNEIVKYNRSTNNKEVLFKNNFPDKKYDQSCEEKINLTLSNNGEYVAFMLGEDSIGIVSKDGQNGGIVLKNAKNPLFID